MKDNEMLFEIIYIVCGLWFHCYTGEGVKFHRK